MKRKDVQMNSSLEGWLGTSTYRVSVRATHRETKLSVSAESRGKWESRQAVERRALVALQAKVDRR